MDKYKKILILILLFLLLVIGICACLFGSTLIPFHDYKSVLLQEPLSQTGYILKYIRIPRVVAAIVAGVGLATAGVIIQTVFANPLAGPNIIGVNSGAGFAIVLFYALFPNLYAFLPFAAFFGAFLALLFVYLLGISSGTSKYSLILAGMAINCILNSATDMVYLVNDKYMIDSKMFKIGSLNGVNTTVLLFSGILIVVCFILTLALHNQLEILSLSDETAKSLGLSVQKYRLFFLLLASVLAGASISFAGLIGFVGLIVPHMARQLIGEECKYLLAVSASLGGILLCLCDTLGRTLFQPYEVPVGIFLAFLGAPFFIFLLLSSKRRR